MINILSDTVQDFDDLIGNFSILKISMSKLAAEDETACTAAKKFTDLFYDAVDRKRNKMNFLYADGATLVWNGNAIQGVDVIAKFYDGLPNSTHT